MCSLRIFFKRLILCSLIISSIQLRSAESSKNPLLIHNVELLRRGKQISVLLFTNYKPVYDITENLSSQTLVIKFKEARVAFLDGRMERLFSDHQISGIRFLEIGNEIWAQFKLLEKNLSYTVTSLNNVSGLRIDFRPVIDVKPLPDPPEDAAFNLDEVKFDSSNANFTRIIFNLSKNDYISSKSSISEDKKPPRIFLLEDKNKNHLRIRLPNTLPNEKLGEIILTFNFSSNL